MDTEARRQALNTFKAGQRKALIDSLPMPADLFHQLFEMLDERLIEDGCDHSLRWTEEFLSGSEVDTDAVLAWLAEHGGFCDCEVLANVEDEVRE
jgi:hypothetical protein